mgnify:CR=1 FL=1
MEAQDSASAAAGLVHKAKRAILLPELVRSACIVEARRLHDFALTIPEWDYNRYFFLAVAHSLLDRVNA